MIIEIKFHKYFIPGVRELKQIMDTISNIVTEVLRFISPSRISLTNFFGNFVFKGGFSDESDCTSDKSFANNNKSSAHTLQSNNHLHNQSTTGYDTESSLTTTTPRINPITAASNTKRQLPQPLNAKTIHSSSPNSLVPNLSNNLATTNTDSYPYLNSSDNHSKNIKSKTDKINPQVGRSPHALIRAVKKRTDTIEGSSDVGALTRFDSLTSTPPPLLHDAMNKSFDQENDENLTSQFLQSNHTTPPQPQRKQQPPFPLSQTKSKQRPPSTTSNDHDNISFNSQNSSSRNDKKNERHKSLSKTNNDDLYSEENISVFSKEKLNDTNSDKKRLHSTNSVNSTNLDERKYIHPRLRWLQAYHCIRQQLVSTLFLIPRNDYESVKI